MIDTSPYPFHSILDILIGHCHSFTFSQSNSSGWQINPVARANTNILIIFNLICLIQRDGNRDTFFMNLLPLCYCWVSTAIGCVDRVFQTKDFIRVLAKLSKSWEGWCSPHVEPSFHSLTGHTCGAGDVPWWWLTSSSSSLFTSPSFSTSNFLQTSLPLLTLLPLPLIASNFSTDFLFYSFTSPLTFPEHQWPCWQELTAKEDQATPLHSIPPHLLLGVHFSSPPPTCQILSCLSRSIRPQIVLHLFYLVSLTHTLIHPISKVTYARTC